MTSHRKACGITNSGWPAGSRSNSSDNNLRLERLDSCSNGFRANAAAERPSPSRDENQPLKPKRRSHTGVRRPPQSAPAGPHSRPRHKNENGAVPEHEHCPRGVRHVMRPPNSQRRSKDQRWGRHRRQHQSRSCRKASRAAATSATGGERPSPRSLKEGVGRCLRRGEPRLSPPSASARMTKILEAEGGAEAAARLASPHQTAHW
jgi:hypothetical protein